MFENRSSIYRQQQDPLPAGYNQSGFNPHQNEMAFTQKPNNQTNQTVGKPVYSPHPPPEQEYAAPQSRQQPTTVYSPKIVQSTTPIKQVSYLIDWIVCILPIFFFVVILILMVCLQSLKIHHLNPEGAHATMEKLQKNLLAPPILDIIELPAPTPAPHTLRNHYLHNEVVSEGVCPAGYGKASLGNWEGVNSGCICDDGEVKSKAYCTLHFASDKCKSVKSKDQIFLSHWKGRQYCLKHLETWKWVAGVDCPKEQKKCGGNICIPAEHICPLSELRLMTAAPTPNDSTVKIGSKVFLKVHEIKAPLVDLEIIPGNADTSECFNNNIGPQFPSKKFYPLSKRPQKGCDKYKNLETYTTGLDSELVKEVNKQNKIVDKLKEIPFYEKYLDPTDTYELDIIRRIEIKNLKECGSIHPDKVTQITKKSQRVYNFEANLSIVILILCLIILVLAPILYILRKKVFTSISMPEHHQPKLYAFVAIIVVALCLVLGFVYLTDVDGDGGLKANNKDFAEYKKHECFVDQGLALAVNEVDQFALKSYQSSYSWIISAFYISIGFMIVLILLVVYQYSVHGEMFANPWKDRIVNQFKYEQYN